MRSVAIIGAGAGGAAAVAELTLAGHEVRLWNRSAATLEPSLNLTAATRPDSPPNGG